MRARFSLCPVWQAWADARLPGTRLAACPPAEIIAFDNVLVVYKFVGDLHFYATADGEENEIVLALVLSALVDTISLLLTCVALRDAAALGALALHFPCLPALTA